MSHDETSSDQTERTVPLVEEQLRITKTQVVTDRLRVSTVVEERAVTVESTLEKGNVTVERIAVQRAVMQAPEPRQEGDTLIVSIVEERLVAEKRLFVIEELHITRTRSIEQVSLSDTVRTMRATIDRPAQSSDIYGSQISE